MKTRLNDHLIRWLTTHLRKYLCNNSKAYIDQVLSIYFSDCIVITWNLEDVMHVAEEHDVKEFYADDARQVLYHLECTQDANVGINWDVIWMAMQEYLAERDEGLAKDQTKVTSANAQPEGQ